MAHEIEIYCIAGIWQLRPLRFKQLQASACPSSAAFAVSKLGEDKRFPDSAYRRGLPKSLRRPNIQQSAKQASVSEIEFWALDDGLGSIREPRLKQYDLTGSFQHRQPMVRRGRRNPDVACQICFVQQVGGTECAGAQESLEVPQAAHVGQRPYIALEVRSKVRVVEGYRINVWVGVQLRETTAHNSCFDLGLWQCDLNLGK